MNKVNIVNQKDDKVNITLHYAVELSDYYMTNLLAYNKADPNIKNNDGITSLDLAKKDKNLHKYIILSILLYDFSLIGRDLHSCRSFLLLTRPIMVKDKTRSLSKEVEVAAIFLNISRKNSYISITFKEVSFLSVNMTTYLIEF